MVCVATYGIGRTSEVWLARQLVSIRRLRVEALSGPRSDEELRSPETVPVHAMPFALEPDLGPRRWLRRALGAPQQNFYAATPAEARVLTRTLRAIRPDVILCHYGPVGLRLLPVARKLGIPIVVHFHGVDISRSVRNRWYRYSLEKSLHAFAALVVVADHQRDWIVEHAKLEPAPFVVPCGVPCSEFEPSSGVSLEPCRFLSVGRLVPKKAPLEVIRAFAACAGEVPGVELTLVGGGPLQGATEALARSLGVSDAVRFLGAQPNSRVKLEMSRAGVFLQHSVRAPDGDMEGWPVSIGEAAASSLPVIATRHAGIPTQIRDGETGFLVDEGDWRAMATAMIELARNAQKREHFGRAGRQHVASRFDLAQQVAKLEDVLLEVAGEAGR